MTRTLLLFSLLFIWILSSCGIAPAAAPPAPLVMVTADQGALPTPTPFQPANATVPPPELPTLISTFTPLPPTDTPLPTLEFTATTLPSPTAPAPSARTQYTMFALLDYYNHQLAVDETVTYTNQTGVPLGELVMAVEPNLRGGFTLENILLDATPLNYDLNGQRL
ncbi:MAG TPA: hypothetical protein VNA23_05740, partial [Anaerolineales bacterium]|nr:hypothetical protein [Anaerolineales bacterium]